MAEKKRDYARESVTAKARGETYVSLKLNKTLKEDFSEKCAQNGTTMNAVLKAYIERYLSGEF